MTHLPWPALGGISPQGRGTSSAVVTAGCTDVALLGVLGLLLRVLRNDSSAMTGSGMINPRGGGTLAGGRHRGYPLASLPCESCHHFPCPTLSPSRDIARGVLRKPSMNLSP